MSPVREREKEKGVRPELPSALEAKEEVRERRGGGKSSLRIVPVAVEAVLESVAAEGLERERRKDSSSSMELSPETLKVSVLRVSLTANVSVPEGKEPAKSLASAGLEPKPLTAH